VHEPDIVVWFPANIGESAVVLDVDTHVVTAAGESGFGVLCRLTDQENFYAILLNNEGAYSMWRLQDGEWTALTNWSNTSASNTDDEVTNHLQVACVGNTIVIVINGQVVDVVEDDAFSGGDVALVVKTGEQIGMSVAFDNLSVFAK
jgi:uncharacterized protein YbdZ (MbtH family)